MSVNLNLTLQHGTFCTGICWEELPLNAEPNLVCELPLADGIIELLVLANRLVVEVTSTKNNRSEPVDQWITPEIIKPAWASAVLSLQWENGFITTFRLNAKDVPRHFDAEEFNLDCKPNKIHPPELVALREVNLRKLKPPNSLDFRNLIQTALRLESSLKSIRSDNTETILDIAVHLRTLLCGGAKNGGQLLFRCAQQLGMNPVCYTLAGLDDHHEPNLFANDGWFALLGGVAATPWGNMRYETDLNDWLEQPAIWLDNRTSISHRKLIREVAGKFGAHADKSAEILEGFINYHDTGLNLGVLVPQFMNYAQVAIDVSKLVLLKSDTKDVHDKER